MNNSIHERDWKALKKIRQETLEMLCARINEEGREILDSEDSSEHEKYLALYRHLDKSDDIVADCFNDWRRSNAKFKLLFLQREGLLSDSHIQNFSEEIQFLLQEFWK
jgi:5'-deoxynucleotidase YfbR-like HD superfamily hydrolase